MDEVRLGAPAGLGGDFELTDQSGQPWSLRDIRGKAALIYFGFTMCPDACPVTMSKIAAAHRLLSLEPDKAATIFISVDRERDTPEVIKDYLTSFSLPIIGLTGTKEQIEAVTKQYEVQYVIEAAPANYSVAHTTSLFLIDRDGVLRHIFPYEAGPGVIASGLRQVLEQEH
jgi:cytochrome oxidase Cu insertion factor (SCO1/SenC/PrrC family)